MVFGPALNSWFPPASWNGINTWRILCVMNGVWHNFTQRVHMGNSYICHPGGVVGKPRIAPRVSTCSYSHPLEVSENCPGENVLGQLTDGLTHSKPAPSSVNSATVHSGKRTGSRSGGHSKPHSTRDSGHFIRNPPLIYTCTSLRAGFLLM